MKSKKQNSQTLQLIDILSDQKNHDGDQLGQALNVTRAAVWKQLHKLIELGVPIESAKGRGYALSEAFTLLDQKKISDGLANNARDVEIEVFESIESTNQYVQQSSNEPSPLLVLAEQQSSGRGRFARPWHSPFGQNLYLTLGLPVSADFSKLSGLSLIVGLSVVESLKRLLAEYELPTDELTVKWPNDIYWQGQKLGGVLVEARAEMHTEIYLAIGLGLNVNMLDVPTEADIPNWTSLRKICGKYIERNQLTVDLVQSLIRDLDLFAQDGLSPFLQQWNNSDFLFGKQIKITLPNEQLSGTANGISESGLLKLLLEDGSEKEIAAGEATLK